MPRTCGTYRQPFWSSTAAVDGTGNARSPRPSFTYTNTFCSVDPLPATTVSVVAAPSCSQYGSDDLLIGSGAGAVPVKRIVPVIAPAVAGSIGLATTGCAGGVSCCAPPHAATHSAVQSVMPVALRRSAGLMNIGAPENSQLSHYGPAPPAAVILRSTRS